MVSVRQAQTVARVRDGQTIVIAGLIRERKRNLDTGTPGLMDIPLLGYLFRQTQEIKEKSELVILITPEAARGIADPGLYPPGSGAEPGISRTRKVWMKGNFVRPVLSSLKTKS